MLYIVLYDVILLYGILILCCIHCIIFRCYIIRWCINIMLYPLQAFVKDYLITFVRLLLGIDQAVGSGHLSCVSTIGSSYLLLLWKIFIQAVLGLQGGVFPLTRWVSDDAWLVST